METVQKELSEWIRDLRLNAGLSRHEASRLAGCSEDSLERWESGASLPLSQIDLLVRTYKVAPKEAMRSLGATL